jgi:hypothetical protein
VKEVLNMAAEGKQAQKLRAALHPARTVESISAI